MCVQIGNVNCCSGSFLYRHSSSGNPPLYERTIADKVGENDRVMHKIRNNLSEQAFQGDFPQDVDDAVMDSADAHQNQTMQILSDPQIARGFARVVFDILINNQ